MKRIVLAGSLLAALAMFFYAESVMANDKAAKADAKVSAKADTNVKLDRPTFQAVRDRLFGTPTNGLLDGTSKFNLHVKDMTMTTADAAFFTTTSSSDDFAAMIKTCESLHGVIQIDGTLDGEPFHLNIAGKQLKLEGLTLTEAQRTQLVASLQGIEGLKEMKIGAVVDGKQTVTKISGGHEKLELLGRGRDKDDRDHGKGARVDANAKADARIDGPARIDARSETSGRIGVERVTPGLGRR